MRRSSIKSTKALILTPLVVVLLFAVACGSSAPAEPVIVEKEVIKEVIKEVPVEKIVIKEVIKEVVVEKQAASIIPTGAPTATPLPQAVATSTPAPVMTVKGKYGGIVNMHAYQAIDPRAVHEWSTPTMHGLSPMMNSIMEFNPETAEPTDVRCDLCESWSLGPDARTYTFKLRDNARFINGDAVTAEDYDFSMKSMVDPNQFPILEGQIRSSSIQSKNYYESSRIIDPLTWEVTIENPAAVFIQWLAIDTAGIMSRRLVLDEGIMQTFKDPFNIKGTGPFILTDYEPDVSSTYEKNEDYFKEGRPYLDGMKHFVIPDAGRVIAAFETGQILMGNSLVSNLSPIQAIQLQEDNRDTLTVWWGGPTSGQGLMFNVRESNAPFDDLRVRKAIHLVLDRQAVIETISRGKHLLGLPMPPGSWFGLSKEESAQVPGYRYLDGVKHPEDIAEAKRLWAEAGVPDGFEAVITARNCCGYPDEAVLMVNQINKALGTNFTTETVEAAAGYARYDVGDFQMISQSIGMAGGILDPDGALLGHIPAGATRDRWIGWSNPALVDIFAEQQKEQDTERRRELTLQAQDIILNDTVTHASLYWQLRNWVVDNRIQNFNVPASTATYKKHDQIWCDPAC